MQARKLGIAILVLVSMVTSSFVIAGTDSGLNRGLAGQRLGGNILYVGGSGPGNYTKIQDAIDNASDGDTIFVFSGTYHECLMVNKSVYLIGANREETVVDGGKRDSSITIKADNVVVENFTFRNFNRTYDGWSIINVDIKRNGVTFTNNTVRGGWWGVYVNTVDRYMGRINIYNTTISYNLITGTQIALYMDYNASSSLIKGNYLTDNNFTGIYMEGMGSFNTVICDNTVVNTLGDAVDCGFVEKNFKFFNNTIEHNGGGVHVEASDFKGNVVRDNIISYNGGGDVGFYKDGLYIDGCGFLSVKNNTIEYNANDGIALVYDSLSRGGGNGTRPHGGGNGSNIIENNYIAHNSGSGVYISGAQNNTVIHNQILDNIYFGVVLDNLIGIVPSINDTISYNNISGSKTGVYIYNSYYNFITFNNIFDNDEPATFHYALFSIYYVLFSKSPVNTWNANYWGGEMNMMKIRGKRFIIPWFNFDFHPASEPYNWG